MAIKKKAKKQTLTEFQAWLEGVEEIQPSGWAPDPGQWEMIRTRIANIKPDAPVSVQESAVSGNVANPHNPYGLPQPGVAHMQGYPNEFIPPPPVVPTAFDRAGIPQGMSVSPGGAPLNAGIPPGSGFAQPDQPGIAPPSMSQGGQLRADGTTFE